VSSGKLPAHPVLNSELTAASGHDVLQIEVVRVATGDELQVAFIDQNSEWRQGVWLAVDGEMEVAGARARQLELWTDAAPATVSLRIVSATDGLLRLYNIWDSGRGRRMESQSATSGMIKESPSPGTTIYRCNDIGRNPAFNKLVFELRRHV
jgi:hypothetical protein